MKNASDPSEPDFKTMTAKARFGWGCLAGLGLGMGIAFGFALPPGNNYLAGLISIPICTPVGDLHFLSLERLFLDVFGQS